MNDSATPVARILVLDEHPEHARAIKAYCDANSLVPLRVRPNRVMTVLASNINLGAVVVAEDCLPGAEESAALALKINTVRPELPLILRRSGEVELPDALRQASCAQFAMWDLGTLGKVLDQFLFSVEYPNALVRGIMEITADMLYSMFPGAQLRQETPYIVRDRTIFGEVFSLIPLESPWCRGYMMLQTEENRMLDYFHGSPLFPEGNFREVNSFLGELTNLIWGVFKNRYIGSFAPSNHGQTQVPLIINHQHRYISFGTENPHLCFRHHLTDPATGKTVTMDQRFIFNLSWSPEDFQEVSQESVSEAGAIDFF